VKYQKIRVTDAPAYTGVSDDRSNTAIMGCDESIFRLYETWKAAVASLSVSTTQIDSTIAGALILRPAGWNRKFNEPIPLPKGKPLVTLRDAANYITKLPKAEHDAQEWQAAMKALLLVAERGGPTMFARIGVMLALNRQT
jgi:hypothetical protein